MRDRAPPLDVPRRSLFTRLFGLLSSVKLAIVLLVLILIYSTLGSAIPVFRQYFELTEFQFFNHWIFVTLIGVFCLNLALATVRYIPLSWINGGSLITHAGMLVLCAGSVLYFGRKIEGDVWLDAPRVQVISASRVKSGQNPVVAQFVPMVGRVWDTNMPMIGGRYKFEVLDVQHDGMLTAASVRLRATVANEASKEVVLTQGDREGAGSIQQVNEKILVRLAPATVTNIFYDEQTPMLLVEAGNQSVGYELPALPYYQERFVSDVEPIVDTANRPVTSRRSEPIRAIDHWRMPTPMGQPATPVPANWPLTMDIDGYLPYAELQQSFTDGGTQINPLINVRLPDGADHWLLGKAPSRSMDELSENAVAEFRWLSEESDLDKAWTRPIQGQHVLDVYVKDKDIRRQYDVSIGQKIAVEGTDYTLTIEQLNPSWPLMTAGFENAKTPVALVWVETPERQFQRSVLQRYPHLDQDRDRAGKKILDTGSLVDENLELQYTDASGHHFLIAAGANLPPMLVHTVPGGKRWVGRIEVDKPYQPANGPTIVLSDYIEKPRSVSTPVVVPENVRRPFSSVRRQSSLVRVHLKSTQSAWEERVWVPFSQYNASDPQVPATPVADVPGLGDISLIYGRTPRYLPGRLTLEYLKTDFYPGRERASGWASFVRYEDPSTRQPMRPPKGVWLNHTVKVGHWTLFQSGAAGDHESWTILGVGNRDGVASMLLGCILITLGMAYAFCVRPLMARQRRRQIIRDLGPPDAKIDVLEELDAGATAGRRSRPPVVVSTVILAALLAVAGTAKAAESELPKPAADLLAIQKGIDLERLRTMVVQYNARYSTVEAWAQDMVESIHGSKSLYGLDPAVAAIELMLNARDYVDQPILYVKDRALRKEITAHPVVLDAEEIKRIRKTGLVSFQFLTSKPVADVLAKLDADTRLKKALDRLAEAQFYFASLSRNFNVIPSPQGGADAPWHTFEELLGHMDGHAGMGGHGASGSIPGVSGTDAVALLSTYRDLATGWGRRDATAVNAAIAQLDTKLPTMAAPGVYPPAERRHAEVVYHRLNLLRWGWVCYIAAFFIGVFAVATRYRWARRVVLTLLVIATALHGSGLGLRWYVVGRIPVANMYEAVVSSTWVGAVFGLVLEFFSRKRVYALATAFLGMFALALPELNIIHSKIETMMPILDDIMLRIHTVLIISSYAVITLAFCVANCYLVVAAFQERSRLAQAVLGAQAGLIVALVAAYIGAFDRFTPVATIIGMVLVGAGGAFFLPGVSMLLPRPRWADAAYNSGGGERGGNLDIDLGAPPKRSILEEFDLSHRVLIYTAMIALWVGLVLGAVWADYSWGRPWGWDPKEVFALNTWLIYAILIHARYVTQRRALWTSVLSVIGFAAMQFNWWVVNFYIVGLHSYA